MAVAMLCAVAILLLCSTSTVSAAILKLCLNNNPPTASPVAGYTPVVGDSWLGADVTKAWQGMGIDLIVSVFMELLPGYQYNTTYVGGFEEALYLARIGVCDVVVNSVFMAYSRAQCTNCPLPAADAVLVVDDDWYDFACCLAFSNSYFEGGWSLMTLAKKPPSNNVLKVIFSRPIVQLGCIAVLFVFAVAHLMWFCERTAYNHVDGIAKPYLFARRYLDGLRDGTWFASTTVMSNSLHNKTIVTGPGRLVAVVWVAYGLFMTTYITSILSSTLTTEQLQATTITTAADMAGKSLCTASGFYSYFWYSTFPTTGVRMTLVDVEEECFEMVVNGTVDATFSIREVVVAYFASGAPAGLSMTPIVTPQSYALAWGRKFTARTLVDTALLNWVEGITPVSRPYKTSMAKWYGGNAGVFSYSTGSSFSTPWNKPLVACTCTILGVYIILQGLVIAGSWIHKYRSALDDSVHSGFSASSSRHIGRLSWMSKASAMLSSSINDQELKKSASRQLELDLNSARQSNQDISMPSQRKFDPDSSTRPSQGASLYKDGKGASMFAPAAVAPFIRSPGSFVDAGKRIVQLAERPDIVTPRLVVAHLDDLDDSNHLVDEVVRHLGDVCRAQVRTQVREAMAATLRRPSGVMSFTGPSQVGAILNSISSFQGDPVALVAMLEKALAAAQVDVQAQQLQRGFSGTAAWKSSDY